MDIVYLADVPETIPVVAEWLFSEWGYRKEGNTVEKVRGRLELTLNKSTLHIILVATINKTPVGTVSLRQSDGIENRPKLTPWLASLYVQPEFRGKGIASKLVQHIVKIAQKQGTERLYLRTEDKQTLYQHLGWTSLEVIRDKEEITTIMHLDL